MVLWGQPRAVGGQVSHLELSALAFFSAPLSQARAAASPSSAEDVFLPTAKPVQVHHGKVVLAPCLSYIFFPPAIYSCGLEPAYMDVSPGDFALIEALPDDQIWSEDRFQTWSPTPPLWDSSGPHSLWSSIPWSLRVKPARNTKSNGCQTQVAEFLESFQRFRLGLTRWHSG